MKTRGELIYYLLKPAVKRYLDSKLNIEVESNPLKDIKEPYLLVGHHVNNYDPVISNAYGNTLIRYIAGDANQDSLVKKTALGLLESIPFTKNRADTKSIREMMKHVKQGHPIGLYPEGGRNWDGATDNIIPSTAKLIKMLKIPVYAIFYKGGYLSKPRWASYPRRGKIVIEVKQIFDKEMVMGLSTDDLYNHLVDKLYYNEYVWQQKNQIVFKGKNLAEHIQRLLYVCPNCSSVNSFKSWGDHFNCCNCKAEHTVNHFGEIQGCRDFTETVSWNSWQKTKLAGIIHEGFSFSNPELSFERFPEGESKQKGLVQLNLTKDYLKLHYPHQAPQTEEIDIHDISSLSLTFEDFAEFFVGRTKYRFEFDPTRHMSIKLFYDLITAIKGGQ